MVCKVFIIGSCVSRDTFNYDADRQFEVINYYARTSFASLALGIPNEVMDLSVIESEFQRRMVKRDLEKSLLSAVDISDADIILLDFIDERFPVVVKDEEWAATCSSILVSAGLDSILKKNGELIGWSERRRSLWVKGLKRFRDHLASLGVLNRIRFLKTYWADSISTEGTVLPHLFEQAAKENENLDWMYGQVTSIFGEGRFIRVEKDSLVANPQHRWGLSPFHYIDAYYLHVLKAVGNSYSMIMAEMDERKSLTRAGLHMHALPMPTDLLEHFSGLGEEIWTAAVIHAHDMWRDSFADLKDALKAAQETIVRQADQIATLESKMAKSHEA